MSQQIVIRISDSTSNPATPCRPERPDQTPDAEKEKPSAERRITFDFNVIGGDQPANKSEASASSFYGWDISGF